MNDYHVYAIGNALVDIQFEVPEAALDAFDIDKGLMTLIDEARHLALLDGLRSAAGGEHLARACGGSAANTAIAVAQLGGHAFYSCKVAADESGDFYLDDLRANGVDANLSEAEREPGHTGKCLVAITPDAQRSMSTFLGATADINGAALRPEALRRSRYYYMEGYLAASPSGCAAAIEGRHLAEDAGVATALTLSDVNMVQFFGEQLRQMAGTALDLVIANRDEALLFTGAADIPGAIAALGEIAAAVVVTDGAKGSTVYDGERCSAIAAHPARAVDSNGAGDMYAGSLLYGLAHGMDYPTAAALASRTAAAVVARHGPRLRAAHTAELLSAHRAGL